MDRKAAFRIARGSNTQQEREVQSERCPKCRGTMTYFRLRKKEFVCRGCGNVWEKKNAKG